MRFLTIRFNNGQIYILHKGEAIAESWKHMLNDIKSITINTPDWSIDDENS